MPIEKVRPTFAFDKERLEQLRKVVPECFADGKINWEVLKEVLGEYKEAEDSSAEHFGLFWPGKKDARKLAATSSFGTLSPVPGEGADEEHTRNVFIEGENLEVLKLLQKSYAGEVKLILIDPPYNTGKDFIYDDNFTETTDEYLTRAGLIDEDGHKLTTNTKADGRFHSKWLSMMYPRLRLARNLLRQDGLIFVHIGDNEISHLRSLMDEVFGPENFVATFIWNTDGHTDNQLAVKTNHEYILCYQKDSNCEAINDVIDPNTRDESNLHKGFAENSITKNGDGNPPSFVTLPKGFPCKTKELNLKATKAPKDFFSEVQEIGYITRDLTKKYNLEYPIRLDGMEVRDYKLERECKLFSGWANVNKLKAFIAQDFKPLKEESGSVTFYLSGKGVVYYRREREGARNILSVLRNFMTTEKMRSILEKQGIYFSYPKPIDLTTYLLQIGLTENDIVFDFFGGSGTVGHSLYDFNSSQDFNSKFILVQIGEKVPEDSPAYSQGFRSIPEITKKRLKIYSRIDGKSGGNFGFKCFKLTDSNYRVWKSSANGSVQSLELEFDKFQSALKDGWNYEGLRTEIMLLEGFPLDSDVTSVKEFKKNKVERISSDNCDHELVVCFDKSIHRDTIATLRLASNEIFICLDNAITDEQKMSLSDKGLIKTI